MSALHAPMVCAPLLQDAPPKLTPADPMKMVWALKVSVMLTLEFALNAQELLIQKQKSLLQTAPEPQHTATLPKPLQKVTSAPCHSALPLVPLQWKVKLLVMHGKTVMPPILVFALTEPVPHGITVPPMSALMPFALNAMKSLPQEKNAPLLQTKTPTTHAKSLPESASKVKKPESQEVALPESLSVPSCSSVPLLDSHSTAARRTVNLTMPCKRLSSE